MDAVPLLGHPVIAGGPIPSAVSAALAEVFPWISHLSAAECQDFTQELIAALSDSAELAIDDTVGEVIAGWRATARIKADPAQYAQARKPTEGDFGPVQVEG